MTTRQEFLVWYREYLQRLVEATHSPSRVVSVTDAGGNAVRVVLEISPIHAVAIDPGLFSDTPGKQP